MAFDTLNIMRFVPAIVKIVLRMWPSFILGRLLSSSTYLWCYPARLCVASSTQVYADAVRTAPSNHLLRRQCFFPLNWVVQWMTAGLMVTSFVDITVDTNAQSGLPGFQRLLESRGSFLSSQRPVDFTLSPRLIWNYGSWKMCKGHPIGRAAGSITFALAGVLLMYFELFFNICASLRSIQDASLGFWTCDDSVLYLELWPSGC